MRTRIGILLALALAALLAGLHFWRDRHAVRHFPVKSLVLAGAPLQCTLDERTQSGQHSIRVHGIERRYYLHRPPDAASTSRLPLVFGFHAHGGSGREFAENVEQGQVEVPPSAWLVFPDGVEQPWWDGARGWDGRAMDTHDIALVSEIARAVQGTGCVASDQIYAVGFSWGGWMAAAVGCAFGAQVRGVGLIAGGPPMVAADACAGPVRAIVIHGRADKAEPFSVGVTARDKFARINRCASEAGSSQDPCTDYTGCLAGSALRWCPHTGGHGAPQWAWPALWKFLLDS